ncbi:MAG: HNH endonuclease [Gammaproteobacteria bacterium]|nr:MAG: HNH endonuclease [Gammaproteobacteria bacterium]HMY90359.1 HNH endonuclease [Nitrosomonas sp.]HNJ38200.1 HNH endonuclease [Nitrosomonas sp.]
MIDDEEKLLTPLNAAIHLGITVELLFQFTKLNFTKSSGLRSLKTKEKKRKTWFVEQELYEFDKLLAGYWCGPSDPRPSIPKAILDHLRAESHNQCARCGSGSGVDTAHIIPWSISRSHHPNNLIRICSSCHREHDAQQSLASEDLRKIKQELIDRTRSRLRNRILPPSQKFRPPRCSKQFFGRERELQILIDALQLGESVVVNGVGGIGKSELVLQALSRIETGRTVIWCDIEQYRHIADFVMALRTALSSEGIACNKEEIPYRLDDMRACVVFDSIEQSSLENLDDFEDTVTQLLQDTYHTQFVLTSQITLYRFPSDICLKLDKLDASASLLLFEKSYIQYRKDSRTSLEELLKFCDGHALTIQFAGALAEYYGGTANVMLAIQRNGARSVRLPDRKHHSRQTSLILCLEIAYTTLSIDCKKLLWALALSPAGLFKENLENNWGCLEDSMEALAILRRWHFVNDMPINDKLSRSNLLTPIRQFVLDRARTDEQELFDDMVHYMFEEFEMMVAVLELNYDSPEDTFNVMRRYEMELPNLLGAIKLTKSRESDYKLLKTAISIARSLMRYFFVSRLPEQGAQVILDAADMAIRSSNWTDASSLAAQFMALASRSFDDSLITKGINLVDRIESAVDSLEYLPDLVMSRAIAAQQSGEFLSAEQHARKALKGYQYRLRTAVEVDKVGDHLDLHNDISNSLGILGYSLLSQERYKEAREAYRHSLSHVRGSSIGVNRGQILHQLGNCESYLGNFKSAAEFYFQAVKVFHSVEMIEYLSNAFSELGYTFLDTYQNEILNHLNEELVDSALLDLRTDILRVLNPAVPLNHQHCIQVIRKLFGTIILVSIAEYGKKLNGFCLGLENSTTTELRKQMKDGTRERDDFFAVMMVDLIFYTGALIAQGEVDFEETGDISRETTSEFLRVICEAHDWAHEVMRFSDWLSVYFTRRWVFKEISPSRLQEFILNYRDGIDDYIDLKR